MINSVIESPKEIIKKYSEGEISKRCEKIRNNKNHIAVWKCFGYENIVDMADRCVLQFKKAQQLKSKIPILYNDVAYDSLCFYVSFIGSCENIKMLHDFFECLNFEPFSKFGLAGDIQFYYGIKPLYLLGIDLPLPLTDIEFSNILVDLAKKLLSSSVYSELLEKSDAKEIFHLREKFAKHKSQNLNVAVREKRNYTKLVRKWIKDQTEYMQILQESKKLNNDNNLQNVPKTLKIDTLAEGQIKSLRKNLVERGLIENIKEEDFLYIF